MPPKCLHDSVMLGRCREIEACIPPPQIRTKSRSFSPQMCGVWGAQPVLSVLAVQRRPSRIRGGKAGRRFLSQRPYSAPTRLDCFCRAGMDLPDTHVDGGYCKTPVKCICALWTRSDAKNDQHQPAVAISKIETCNSVFRNPSGVGV